MLKKCWVSQPTALPLRVRPSSCIHTIMACLHSPNRYLDLGWDWDWWIWYRTQWHRSLSRPLSRSLCNVYTFTQPCTHFIGLSLGIGHCQCVQAISVRVDAQNGTVTDLNFDTSVATSSNCSSNALCEWYCDLQAAALALSLSFGVNRPLFC